MSLILNYGSKVKTLRFSAPTCPLRRMQKCECQQVAFREVIDHAQTNGEWDFDTLREQVGCGQICTACHCDLKCALNAAQSQNSPSELPLPVRRIPAFVRSMEMLQA